MKKTFLSFPARGATSSRVSKICALFFASFASLTLCHAQDNVLKRKVTVSAESLPLETVLMEISDLADFTFSYDASIIASNKTVTVEAKNETLKSTLDQILPQDVDYKVNGNHLILLKRSAGSSRKITVSGVVYDAKTNTPLPDVVVYEISSLVSSLSAKDGSFSLHLPVQFEQLGLSFNKKAYADSIIFLTPKDQKLSLYLYPEPGLVPAEKLENISPNKASPIESLTIVQQVVPSQSITRTGNMSMVRKKLAQVSFLPMMGTNLKMSGLVENAFSFNVLIGYAYGVDVLEIGGLFNIVRKNVNGVQVGGLGNLVGNETQGVQVAGLFNHNRGSLVGFQVSGVNNMIIDTLAGVQIAGVNNILQGGMKGWQVAGVNNYTTRSVDGVQIAGVSNLTSEDVKMLQIAGVANKCNEMDGVQIAGVLNFAEQDVKGVQLAGVANISNNVDAFQFAGVVNFALGTVSGTQLSGVLNYARETKRYQLGLINIADTASGVPVGLVSFVRKGFHAPEISSNEIVPVNVAFKTGVKRFYNIFSAGTGSWQDKKLWMFGYGFGTERELGERTFFSFEFTSNWVNEGEGFQKDLSLLNRLNASFGYRIGKKTALTLGPSFNIFLSEWIDPETGEYLTTLAPHTIVNEVTGTTLTQTWVGGKLAIHW